MNSNFTNDKSYRNSLYFRFTTNKIKSSKNLDIVKYFGKNICFQYFDSAIDDEDISFLKNINKSSNIQFSYINMDSNLYKVLKINFIIDIIDKWKAPVLELKKNEFDNYVNSKSYNFRRMIKKNDNYLKELKFKKGNTFDLWKNILYIDQNSWKSEEESDMFNLSYEHITLLSQIKNSDIEVAYKNGVPVGYSLLIYYNGIYYAAKWGATEEGRKRNAGIICLFNQIKRLSKKKDLYIDLWGRNNRIYDRIATSSIDRCYLRISKNGSKKN